MPNQRTTIRGISLDFANTIYPLRAAETAATVRHLHGFLESRLRKDLPGDTLHDLYIEIRERQFAENRETLRENDFPARLREMITRVDRPPSDELVADAVDVYATGFIETMVLPDGALDVIQELSQRFNGKIVVCSNFIVSRAIVEPLRRDNVLPLLAGVIISCDVGFVKPHPLLFDNVCAALQMPPENIAHVGDDLDADVLGACRAGMTAVYTTEWASSADPSNIDAASPDHTILALSSVLDLFP